MASHSVEVPLEGPVSLADEINKKTIEVHRALNALVMARLPLGLKNRTTFREGILCFSHLYRAFEPTLTSHVSSHPSPRIRSMLSHIYFPEMLRLAAIESDLKFYYDVDEITQDMKDPKAAMQAYAASRTKSVVGNKPHLLLAYAHVMYMALFAGGQHMKAAMARSEALTLTLGGNKDNGSGTHLFTFDGYETKPELDILRERFRSGLRAAEGLLTVEEREEVVAEASEIFQGNVRLVEELDEVCRKYYEEMEVVVPLTTKTKRHLMQQAREMDASKEQTVVRSIRESMLSGIVVLGAFLGYFLYVGVLKPALLSTPVGLA